jgi:hypothetical protein
MCTSGNRSLSCIIVQSVIDSVQRTSIVSLLDNLAGETATSMMIQGGFRNPMMNTSIGTFELAMVDANSFMVH